MMKVLLVLLPFLGLILADTPANCMYEDIRGTWAFSIGDRGHDRTVNCSTVGPVKEVLHIDLLFPDVAVDQYDNQGFWTLIYNQGFEVVIHGRKYFAFSYYDKNGTSFCHKTFPGWTHDDSGHDWACYSGQKMNPPTEPPKVEIVKPVFAKYLKNKYRRNDAFIDTINHAQSSWKAAHYPSYEDMTLETLTRRAGGVVHPGFSLPHPAPHSSDTVRKALHLPEAFDWRNVNGINYVTPVRDQGNCIDDLIYGNWPRISRKKVWSPLQRSALYGNHLLDCQVERGKMESKYRLGGCGSCYAFASMALNEARIRIFTNNSMKVVLSPQDIVECSEYAQGCEGGFAYLIGGKYAEDFGLVEESCNPYTGSDGPCKTDPKCMRHYSYKYRYIGGFYGGCNEPLMRLALVAGGPIAVGFEVYSDFFNYKGGIYHHTGIKDKYNPFEETNHAVLVVGYGQDSKTGEKFWSVKNSWGGSWGEDGYFRILRATDECGIESVAMESFPIV